MMYVLALYIPHEEVLPDIYQEYGKIRYFKTGNEAEDFLHNLYKNNALPIVPLIEDNMILMSVQ
jgi:hypothetical protein|tara:strand:+ start:391 stop:582 length:192 start_codon:yes stop_codon:yes gene_type:complete